MSSKAASKKPQAPKPQANGKAAAPRDKPPPPPPAKAADNYDSSSEEEGELDEATILDSLYKHYQPAKAEAAAAAASSVLAKTSGCLENLLQSGAATCLICIGSVRRSDAVWSCKHCFCLLHLNCVRRWATDSMAHMKAQTEQQRDDQGHYNYLGEFVPPKKVRSLHWCCPQCREEYPPGEKPSTYECFCGREQDPEPQPWLLPHSCGEMCNKRLQPECGHSCRLLCHPGPCPPCAQYAVTKCVCGKTPAKSVRCSDKLWRCSQKCSQVLPCGKHVCAEVCHPAGQCPPCKKQSVQPCECGSEKADRPCFQLEWHCKRVCQRKYACGLHTCKRVCHSGPCGECPLGLPRTCPCGKTEKVGPCTEQIDTCGDTCQKTLPCGLHTCTQRCHRGECNLCNVITKKKCRCGRHEKEWICSKLFTCETKCKQMRDCGKHVCNRKCCDGNCPPCDKVCGKTLSCKKHKCQSICHDGLCYPCGRQSQVNCRCGKTSKMVPCGRERSARIGCNEPCRIQSKCHHPTQHRCHKKECPPCQQRCGLRNETTGCEHPCQAKCHAAVREYKTPDVAQPHKERFQYRRLPHPRCEQRVTVQCIGGHELAEWPCWNSKPSSCQRKCNRALRCGNHKCQLVCHTVTDPKDDKQQPECAPCEEGCYRPRPPGCIHPCPGRCHLPPCHPCNVHIKSKCHCGISQVIYKCSEFYAEGSEAETAARQERLKCCGNRCLKNYPCGHRCSDVCHSGVCPNPQSCRKKVKIFCPCKRLKAEVSCDKHRAGQQALPCSGECEQERSRLDALQQQQAEQQRQQEALKQQRELDEYEKKYGNAKRKPKDRKVQAQKAKKEVNWRLIGIYAGIALAVVLAITVALYDA